MPRDWYALKHDTAHRRACRGKEVEKAPAWTVTFAHPLLAPKQSKQVEQVGIKRALQILVWAFMYRAFQWCPGRESNPHDLAIEGF
jgi:hypothetical protein